MSRYTGRHGGRLPYQATTLPVPDRIGSACPQHGPTSPIGYPGGDVYLCAVCGWRDARSRELIDARRSRMARTVETVRAITDADRYPRRVS
jgi:hypothetical protein